MTRPKIFVIAGETSGDLHGAGLITAIKAKRPDVEVTGIGGPKMIEAGQEAIFPSSRLAVVGLVEVFSHLGPILSAFNETRAYLKKVRPDLLILIDYPDFNLIVAGMAKRLGIPVFYYIGPQVWAWRQGRVGKLKSLVDRMAVILPFEEEFYADRGLKVNFVGHPLLDCVKAGSSKEEFCVSHGLYPDRPIIALLPGSRHGEVRRVFPVMLEAARIMAQTRPEAQFAIAVAPSLGLQQLKDMTKGHPNGTCPEIRFVQGMTYDVMAASDLAIAASGTVTLEAAILGCPVVVIYKLSPLTYFLGRRFIKVPYASLVNLIAGKKVVPELLQNDATPEGLAKEALLLLDNGPRRQKIIQGLDAVRMRLGEPGAADRAAGLALELL